MSYRRAAIVILAISLIGACVAQDAAAKTTKYENDNQGLEGKYTFKFLTSNDIERSESGGFDKNGDYVVEGFYSFLGDDGRLYYVSYTADKTGYHPTVRDYPTPDIEPFTDVGIPPPPAALPPAVVASLLG